MSDEKNIKYAHSFTVTAHTPFGDDEYLFLVDELAGELEVSTQRGSVKTKKYIVGEDLLEADFCIETPMTTSVHISFKKNESEQKYVGIVEIGEFLSTPVTAKRHQ